MTTASSEGNVQNCPNCGQLMQVYRRAIRRKMVQMLSSLLKEHGDAAVKSTRIPGYDGGGDFAKLRYWWLIRPGEQALTWCITARGVDFLIGRISVKKYVWIYDDKIQPPPADAKNPEVFAYDIAPEIINKETALRDSMPMPMFDACLQGQGDIFQ